MSDESSEIVPSEPVKPVLRAGQKGIYRRAIDTPLPTAPVHAVTGVLGDIGDNVVTSRAEEILGNDNEQMLWQEKPSLILLLPRFLKYLAILLVVMLICSQIDRYAGSSLENAAELQHDRLATTLREHDTRLPKAKRNAARQKARAAQEAANRNAADSAASDAASNSTDTAGLGDDTVPVHHEARILVLVQYLVALILFGKWIAWLLRLLTTKYSASSQRLIIEEGVLHSINRPWELHQLGDAVISRSLIPKLFGLGNLTIVKPPIELIGLRNPEYVRDLIRQGGQQEAQRIDKIRWR